jgi:hypothetical protein
MVLEMVIGLGLAGLELVEMDHILVMVLHYFQLPNNFERKYE